MNLGLAGTISLQTIMEYGFGLFKQYYDSDVNQIDMVFLEVLPPKKIPINL
jgi:hypothetical protein